MSATTEGDLDFDVWRREGREIQPSAGRRFYISTETFNPCHLLMEHEP